MLDERGAVFDPVAVVEIEHAVVVADAAAVDMATDMPVEASHAGTRGNAGFEVFNKAACGTDAQFDRKGYRQIVEAEAAAQAIAVPIECADKALHDVADMQEPGWRAVSAVEFVAMTDVVAAAIRTHMHRVERNVDPGKALAGVAAQLRIMVAGDVGDARSACGDGQDFFEYGAVRGVPIGLPQHVLEIDDVADEIEFFAARRTQEIEQIRRLAIAQAQMHVGDKNAAVLPLRHGFSPESARCSISKKYKKFVSFRRQSDDSTCFATGRIASVQRPYIAADGCKPSSTSTSA